MRPDRVVIGTEDVEATAILNDLYRPLYLIDAPVLMTDIPTAELTKYAANAFLFSIPGMGKLFYEAILGRDYMVVMGVFSFTALLTLVGLILADILYAVTDPRIKFE